MIIYIGDNEIEQITLNGEPALAEFLTYAEGIATVRLSQSESLFTYDFDLSDGNYDPKTKTLKFWTHKAYQKKYNMDQDSTGSSLNKLSYQLPGGDYYVGSGCPACPFLSDHTLRFIIVHLNDHHRWAREQIADWLESIHDPTGENGPNLNFMV